MPQVGDIMRYTQCGNVLGEEACNVLYLVVSAWTGNIGLEAVLEIISDVFTASAVELQATGFEWRRFLIDNVTDGVESAEYVLQTPLQGAVADTTLPPYAAYSFRQNRATKLTRNGYKRLAGVPESVNINGEASLNAGQAVAATEVEDFYSLPIGSGDFQFAPVIAGRNSAGGVDFGRINDIASCQLQTDLTTQNTRKFGRGS